MEHHQAHGKAAQSVHQLDAGGPFRAAHAGELHERAGHFVIFALHGLEERGRGGGQRIAAAQRLGHLGADARERGQAQIERDALERVDRAKRGFRVRGVHRAGKQLHAPVLREHGQKAQNERVAREALRHVVIAAADERVKFADGHWRSSL